jgi:hypothetical protein
LRTPTPFTFTISVTYQECSTITVLSTPDYAPYFYTADVNGTTFLAENQLTPPDGLGAASTDTTSFFLTFPGLTVTSLTPGESIIITYVAGSGTTSYPYAPFN